MKKVSFFNSIQLKFIIIFILLLFIAVQVIGSYVARELEQDLLNNYKESIYDRMDLLGYNLEQTFNKKRTEAPDEPTLQEDVQQIVSEVDTSGALTIQVVNSQGRVLGTNDYLNREIIGKKLTEDIVLTAIQFDAEQENIVFNSRNGERMIVRVEPLHDENDKVQGAIYLEASLEGVYSQINNINEIFLKGSAISLVVSVIIGVLVARAITKPIIEMRRQAQTMARGDFSQKVKVYGQDEISQLAVTFNHLNDRLKHSMATIEKEQRKLSLVLENMTEGVIATDNKGEITLLNEAAGKLLNQNPHFLINKNLLQLLRLDDEVASMEELEKSKSKIIDFSDEHKEYLLRAEFSAIYDEHLGEDVVSGYIAVLSDVTEEEKMEQERREFVSNVSHELRTPLTTLRSYLESLVDGAWKDPVIAPKFLEVLQNETERMIRMVNSLLQLSRMDSKELKLDVTYTNFVAFFHEIIDHFEMKEKSGKITFVRDFPKEEIFVWIDPDRMTQVLDNIISNAVKYSPDGGTITCKIEKRMKQIIVSIEDEGIGIEYDQLDKIFDRFHRVDKARTRQLGGTGLGLAITRELIDAHDGRIWVDSIVGKGTTIHFTLPLIDESRRKEV